MTGEERQGLRDAVASVVLGWRVAGVKWASGSDVEVWHDPDGDPVVAYAAWRPDEDEVQCVRVVEYLLGAGCRCEIEMTQGTTRVRFTDPGGATGAATAPHRRQAVLMAALAVRAQARPN